MFSFSIIFNISYYYRDILIFLFIKYLIINQKINFYLIYTDIIEMFCLYFKIINFITINLIIYFIFYNMIIFSIFGLYNDELKYIKKQFFFILIIDFISSFFIIIILFPFIWKIFKYIKLVLNFKLLYFESKISEYFNIFFKIYVFTKIYIFILIVLIYIFNYKYIKFYFIKFRKINFFLIIIISLFYDTFTQILFNFLLIINHELIIFYLIFLKNSRIKRDLNPYYFN